MPVGDLTTLANVKQSLFPAVEQGQTTSDAFLQRLITACSAFFQTNMNRTVGSKTYTEVRNGTGGQTLMLRNYPVTSLTSLNVGGTAVAQSNPLPTGTGYILDASDDGPAVLGYVGGCFPRGFQNVSVVYQAGFLVSGEAHAISGSSYQVTTDLTWTTDVGVTIDGVTAERVSEDPSAGQYAVSDLGVYQFAEADEDSIAAVSYGYVPSDIEQAVIEVVSERFVKSKRMDQSSVTQGGQLTAAFTQKDMTPFAQTVLAQRKRVVPI